jgi:cytochrome c556
MGNRLLALMAVMSVVIVLHVGADEKPTEAFQKAMRDTGAAFQTIRAASKEIEDSGAGGQDYAPFETATASLKTTFAATLAFWQAQKVDDAAKLAADGARAVADLEAAAKERDYRLVLEASTALGATCTACHTTHRVRLADGSYLIK